MSYPLAVRKNLKDNEGKRDENLKRLADATGVSGWTVEFDDAYFNDVQALRADVGDLVYDVILGPTVTNLISHIQTDSMVKDGFVEKMSAKRILFSIDKSKDSHGTARVVFRDGMMALEFSPGYSNCNVGRIAEDYDTFLKLL